VLQNASNELPSIDRWPAEGRLHWVELECHVRTDEQVKVAALSGIGPVTATAGDFRKFGCWAWWPGVTPAAARRNSGASPNATTTPAIRDYRKRPN